MTEPAPGHEPAREEPRCYNCGEKGHWAMGCPEEIRETPAGYTAWRQTSSTPSSSKGSEQQTRKLKGPIVTRYPLPLPSTGPIVTRYPPPPVGPPGPSPYGGPPQPCPPYPPPPHGYAPQPSPGPPGPPVSYGQYPPPGPPYYGQQPYVPPGPAGPPGPPGPPGPAGPYPQPYQHSPPPPYPPQPVPPAGSYPPPHYPTPAPHPGYSPFSPYPSSGGYTPTEYFPPHGLAGSPPHPLNQIPFGGHASTPPYPTPGPPGQGPPVQGPPGPHGLPPRPPQRRESQHGRGQESRNKYRNKHGKNGGHRYSSSQSKQDSPAKHQPASASSSRPDSREENTPPAKIETATKASPEPTAKPEGDLKWSEKAIFKEPDKTHPADEVGKPLPYEYTEDIQLPRAWDAKCVRSDYVEADNVDDFARPIRESKHWQSIKDDPAFAKSSLIPHPSLPPKPPSTGVNSLPPRPHKSANYEQHRKRNWEADHWLNSRDQPIKRRRGRSASPRKSWSPPKSVGDAGKPTFRSPAWTSQQEESRRIEDQDADPTDALLQSLERESQDELTRQVSERKAPVRKADSRRNSRDSEPLPLPAPRSRTPPSRRQSWDRPLSRNSRASLQSFTSGSSLSELEAELLGRTVRAKEAVSENGRSRQHDDAAPKIRKRQPKMDAAYGRRW